MTIRYLIRRDFSEIEPHLDAIRTQADSERTALGFLPHPAYAESAEQRKLILLLAQENDDLTYAGHLLFGGIFPNLRVRQICVASQFRNQGHATTLLRALIAQAEKEGYLNIVANVATDLTGANSFYQKNGFLVSRLKAGGATRNRTINVRVLQLSTPSLISLMVEPKPTIFNLPRLNKKTPETPIYAIDLNVFFDAIKDRPRSSDAGAVIAAALRHEIRLAASQEFVAELERNSKDDSNDPVLSFARQIPNLPAQDKAEIENLVQSIATIVFPEKAKQQNLRQNDVSDVLHLAHAVAAGASGYITSDSKVLRARDALITDFNLDVIGLSEFVALIETPTTEAPIPSKKAKHFQIQTPAAAQVLEFLKSEQVDFDTFLGDANSSKSFRLLVQDDEGTIGACIVLASPGIERPSRTIVCVRQDHPFSSTVADFLLSESVRFCSQNGTCHISALDIPSHPITRRVALNQGFQNQFGSTGTLGKISIGAAITENSWDRARLAVERLAGLQLQRDTPHYDSGKIRITQADGIASEVSLFELETLLSPAIFAFPKRDAVVVPIARSFAADLLGTDNQYSLLDVPEAQFLSRRTYFNTTRAVRAMIRGAAIAFYESGKRGGQGAIVALGRIVEVTSIPVATIPEALGRGAVVEDPSALISTDRILATSFDNLVALKKPVPLETLRKIGCVPKTNFVSATPISASHLRAIVDTSSADD